MYMVVICSVLKHPSLIWVTNSDNYDIFIELLKRWNKEFDKIKRYTCFVLDNLTAHLNVSLKKTKLEFVHNNTI